jgi:hypothetical protein
MMSGKQHDPRNHIAVLLRAGAGRAQRVGNGMNLRDATTKGSQAIRFSAVTHQNSEEVRAEMGEGKVTDMRLAPYNPRKAAA